MHGQLLQDLALFLPHAHTSLLSKPSLFLPCLHLSGGSFLGTASTSNAFPELSTPPFSSAGPPCPPHCLSLSVPVWVGGVVSHITPARNLGCPLHTSLSCPRHSQAQRPRDSASKTGVNSVSSFPRIKLLSSSSPAWMAEIVFFILFLM